MLLHLQLYANSMIFQCCEIKLSYFSALSTISTVIYIYLMSNFHTFPTF